MAKIASKWKGVTKYPAMTFKTRIGYKEIENELKKKGKKVYQLFSADVGTWGHINKTFTEVEIQTAKEEWGCHYASHMPAMEQLKESMAYFEKHYRNVDCSPQDIVPMTGVAGGWNVLHHTLIDPGDEVVCIAPAHYFWASASYLHYLGARAVGSRCDEEEDWQPDLEDLRAKINNKTKAIALVRPCNPTGTIYSEEATKGIIDIAGEYDLPVISDEIYCLITYDGKEAKSLASMSNDVPVITLYSTSKFLMKPGWRLGYMNFHDPSGKMAEMRRVVNLIAETYGHGSWNLPTFIMGAGIKAFKGPFDESKEMVKKLQDRRDFTFKRLTEIDGVSCYKSIATLYSFPRVEAIGKTWKTDEDFVVNMLKEEGVLFVPGSFFGEVGFGHFRTLLLPEIKILEEIFDRLERFMARHT